MTPKALELLKALIDADRNFHTKRLKQEIISQDDRGIEISRVMNGFDRRTAEQLVKLGVAEIVNVRSSHNYIFLGKYNPYDKEEHGD